jgi:hypothetical protein
MLALVTLLIFSGCSSQATVEDKQEVEVFVPNLQMLASECYSLCQIDETAYCVEERTLVFDSGLYTTGNCRVFGKYVSDFEKCEGFCKHYGKERGCVVDGVRDMNCDGQ